MTRLDDCEPITPLQAALVKLSEDVAGKYIHLEPAQSKALLDELERLARIEMAYINFDLEKGTRTMSAEELYGWEQLSDEAMEVADERE